jgi:raffinose/stachyose/melibiose transport system substrate-binding protein
MKGNSMRKTTTLVKGAAGLIAIATLAACTAGGGASEGEQTLTITTIYSAAVMEPLVDKFQEENPGVSVRMTVLPPGADTNEVIRTQLSAGQGSDLISSQPGSSPIGVKTLTAAGLISPLSEESWAEEIPQPYKDLVSVDGELYSFPGGLQPIAGFYNSTELDALGLEAPTTWTELLTFCDDARAAGKVAYAAGMADLTVTLMMTYALISTLNDGPNPDFNPGVATGDSSFEDSNWEESLSLQQQMIERGCFSDDATGISRDLAFEAVGTGDALGMAAAGTMFEAIIATMPEGTEYEVVPIPGSDDPAEQFMPGSLTAGLSLNANAKSPELAKQFLGFLAQPENYAAFATAYVGVVPVISDESFEAPEVLSTFTEFVSEDRVTIFSNAYWPNGEIVVALQQGIQGMFLGTTSPADIVASMDAAIKLP